MGECLQEKDSERLGVSAHLFRSAGVGVMDVTRVPLEAVVAGLAVAVLVASYLLVGGRRSRRKSRYNMSRTGKWQLDADDGSRLHPKSSFGGWGRADGELNNPRFVLTVQGGCVLVADSGNDRLQIFSPMGEHVRTFHGTLPGHPTGLATDGTHMWVADSANCSVQKLRVTDGKLITRAGSYGRGANSYSGPQGLALVEGSLFVADEGNHRVAMLEADTLEWRGAFGSHGSAHGQFGGPTGLTSLDGELYVRDTNNHRIQVFDVSGAGSGGVCGAFVRAFGKHGSKPGEFIQPTGMAHDGRGRLLVSEGGACRVQVLTKEGSPLQVLPLPQAGRLYGMCMSGSDGRFDGLGMLFIADYEKHRIHVRAHARVRTRKHAWAYARTGVAVAYHPIVPTSRIPSNRACDACAKRVTVANLPPRPTRARRATQVLELRNDPVPPSPHQ